MGVGTALRGGLDLLQARRHHLDSLPTPPSPTNLLRSLAQRPKCMPLPVTPIAVLRSLVQLQAVQALVWAWILLAIFVLLAWWSNPSDSSFRPFLTDFTFRERLRLLHECSDTTFASANVNNSPKSPDLDTLKQSSRNVRTHLFSTSPFAVTFGSRLSLSVRTPPYVRKDFRLFSIVTIHHSVPLPFVGGTSGEATKAQNKSTTELGSRSATTSNYTSIFIGAFGRWWVGVYALPFQRTTNDNRTETNIKAPERDQLEENREGLPEWGIVEMHLADSEPEYAETSLCRDPDHSKAAHTISQDTSHHNKEPTQDTSSYSPSSPPDAASAALTRDTEQVDLAALSASIIDSQHSVMDLREQLQHLKNNSAKTCTGLQLDLDQLRARKREEDKSRADTKARTKVLDENRRQVEGTKREAEKRLKMVIAARMSKQNSVASKKDEIETLRKRREGHEGKIQTSTSNTTSRIEEASRLTTNAHAQLEQLENELTELNNEILIAESVLASEKANLHAIMGNGSSRDVDRTFDLFTSSGGFFSPEHAHAPLDSTELPRMYFAHEGSNNQAYASLSGLSASPAPPFTSLGDGFSTEQDTLSVDQSLQDVKHSMTLPRRTRRLSANLLKNAFRKAPNPVVSSTYPDPSMEHADKTTTELRAASDFEAMKQAFQLTVASEEEGRRSWSAFDIWQSDMRDARNHWHLSPGVFNGSADSLPHFTNSTLMEPLDRSNSAGYQELSREDDQGFDIDQSRNLAKVKRAFRWPFRPTQAQGEVA